MGSATEPVIVYMAYHTLHAIPIHKQPYPAHNTLFKGGRLVQILAKSENRTPHFYA
jgi:hypothetical protein